MGESNGNKWKDWILQGLFAAFLLLAGWFYNTETTRHQQEKIEANAWQAVQMSEQSRQNERIAVLESQYIHTLTALNEMNRKMDTLLMRPAR